MQALRQARAAPAAAARTSSNPLVARPVSAPKRGATLARRAIELDFSDPDTQLSIAGVVLGLVLGIGAPVWYASRADRDEELLEEVRALNRANYEATGEYLSEVRQYAGFGIFSFRCARARPIPRTPGARAKREGKPTARAASFVAVGVPRLARRQDGAH
jgi:hypothetical protein